MGYRRMTHRGLWEIYRRWRDGQSVSRIAVGEGRDRKTVRRYLAELEQLGLQADGVVVEQQQFHQLVETLVPRQTDRPAPATEQLSPYEAELRELINRAEEPLKPKSAFVVVCRKHDLTVSYESFKRFARQRRLNRAERRSMIRIELPPGLETQLDYGKVGKLVDRRAGRSRVVWAFCGVLAHSRLPYIEFVWTQDQASFTGSVVSMLEYYGGATEFLSVDNLKAGVIKPDLWDPQLNRTLAEAAEYYGTFIDPCRVATPTDKGKIERMIPVAREVFRILKELYPSADIVKLNERARQWCREEYGRREHGTTHIAPMDAIEAERPSLRPLPAERFSLPVWKRASVHGGDQFLTFNKLRFSLPPAWKGHRLWARYAAPLLQLYDDREQLIRQYVVNDHDRVYWVPEDFPEEVREMMNGGYPAWILSKAAPYGKAAEQLLASVMRPHAYLNARRARGMLDIMAAHSSKPYFEEICLRATRHSVVLPATLKRMFEAAARQPLLEEHLPLSPLAAQMVRDVRYYTN